MKFLCQHCKTPISIADVEPEEMVECGKCHNATSCPQPFSPGVIMGDCVIIDSLGQGRLGDVYLAEQTTLNRMVAIKILHEFYHSSDVIIEFFREARIVAKLNHPNIVQSYSVNEEDGSYFLIMEYVEGESLFTYLSSNGHLDLGHTLDIILQVVSALQYAWEKEGIVHHNIKPENILLTKGGQAKLSDLGLVSSRNRSEKKDKSFYRSPEDLLEAKVDFRADIYSLGVVMYEALTGRLPINGQNEEQVIHAHLTQAPEPVHEVMHKLPSEVSQVVNKMLAKHPDDRYVDLQSLENDLALLRRIHQASHGSMRLWERAKVRLKLSDPGVKRRKKKRLQKRANMVLAGLTAAALLIIIIVRDQRQAGETGEVSNSDTYYRHKDFEVLRERLMLARDRESRLLLLRLMDKYLLKYPETSEEVRQVKIWRAELGELLVRNLRLEEYRRLQTQTFSQEEDDVPVLEKVTLQDLVRDIDLEKEGILRPGMTIGENDLNLFLFQKVLGREGFEKSRNTLEIEGKKLGAKAKWIKFFSRIISLAREAQEVLFDSGDKCAGAYVQVDERLFKVHSISSGFIRFFQEDDDEDSLMTVTMTQMDFVSLSNLLKKAMPNAQERHLSEHAMSLLFWHRNLPMFKDEAMTPLKRKYKLIFRQVERLYLVDSQAHLLAAKEYLRKNNRSAAVAQLYMLRRKYGESSLYQNIKSEVAELYRRCSEGGN